MRASHCRVKSGSLLSRHGGHTFREKFESGLIGQFNEKIWTVGAEFSLEDGGRKTQLARSAMLPDGVCPKLKLCFSNAKASSSRGGNQTS